MIGYVATMSIEGWFEPSTRGAPHREIVEHVVAIRCGPDIFSSQDDTGDEFG